MGFGEAIASGFNNYAKFSGRTPRSGFWWWILFIILLSLGVGIVAGILDLATGSRLPSHIAQGVLDLGLLLPNISIAFRRLHDLNRSGWWYGALFLLLLILFGLAIPSFLRIHENQLNGYGATDGIPTAVFLLMGLLGFIAGIWELVLFIWFCMRGTRGQNRFGADPLREF